MKRKKQLFEGAVHGIFLLLGLITVGCVLLITVYLVISGIPAIRNRMVFNNNRRQTPAGGSDFWESGVIRPDLVLHDLCAVFNPQAADTAELYYYKRLE